jgi:hypothetical protein
MTQVILWEDAERMLEDLIFKKISSVLKNYPGGLVEHISTETYSHSYTLVYTICTQKPPHNHSERCYNFLGQMAAKYFLPPGKKREIFIKYVTYCFKYLERFYVKRLEVPTLDLYMDLVMDIVFDVIMDVSTPSPENMRKAELHFVKKAFKKWACDEDLLGHTHADSGAAKKREREWWDENAVFEGKKARASE